MVLLRRISSLDFPSHVSNVDNVLNGEYTTCFQTIFTYNQLTETLPQACCTFSHKSNHYLIHIFYKTKTLILIPI